MLSAIIRKLRAASHALRNDRCDQCEALSSPLHSEPCLGRYIRGTESFRRSAYPESTHSVKPMPGQYNVGGISMLGWMYVPVPSTTTSYSGAISSMVMQGKETALQNRRKICVAKCSRLIQDGERHAPPRLISTRLRKAAWRRSLQYKVARRPLIVHTSKRRLSTSIHLIQREFLAVTHARHRSACWVEAFSGIGSAKPP